MTKTYHRWEDLRKEKLTPAQLAEFALCRRVETSKGFSAEGDAVLAGDGLYFVAHLQI